ncbi:MAG: fused response regulator/thioredoxin-disulfide reductase, partial [Pseudomonadota bacterium]
KRAGADKEEDEGCFQSRNRPCLAVLNVNRCEAILFVGASPFTSWLPDKISQDTHGFLKTGADLQQLDLVKAGWSLDRMPTEYETSWPRVYAVGDVRSGSVKRVASAVGQGSVVVSHIHRALAEVREMEDAG